MAFSLDCIHFIATELSKTYREKLSYFLSQPDQEVLPKKLQPFSSPQN